MKEHAHSSEMYVILKPYNPNFKIISVLTVGRLSLHTSQVAHQPGAYPSFCSMKRLEVYVLPGWDASPSHGYPQHSLRRYPFIHLCGEWHCKSQVSSPRTQHNFPGQGLNPNCLIRTTKPWDSAPVQPLVLTILRAGFLIEHFEFELG